jgi:hypothetical protein
VVSDVLNGPDQYWSTDLPPSRGQNATVVELACRLLGEAPPQTRLEATVLIARLRQAVAEGKEAEWAF